VHDASLKRFDAEIAARVANVDRAVGAGKQPGTITTDVATAIANERKQLAAEAKPIYDAIWQMAPRPILNTSTPKAAAQAIVEGIPPGTRTVFHQIADLPDVITLQQAHEVRTLLREASKPMNLAASGIDKSKIRALKVQIDGMFDQVGSRSDSAPAAVMMMRDVDAKYLQGIRKFEDSVLNKLVKDIKSGFPPDPEVTAATVLRAGNESRAAEIKKIVGPDAWQRIAAIDYRVMMANATTKDGRLDSAALLQEIDKRGRTFEVTHGPSCAPSPRAWPSARRRRRSSPSTPTTFCRRCARSSRRPRRATSCSRTISSPPSRSPGI
jgi:hypothetical protein